MDTLGNISLTAEKLECARRSSKFKTAGRGQSRVIKNSERIYRNPRLIVPQGSAACAAERWREQVFRVVLERRFPDGRGTARPGCRGAAAATRKMLPHLAV